MARVAKPKHEHTITMRKRPARWSGEIGLFVDNQMAEEDFAPVARDCDLEVHVTAPQQTRDLKWCWALANLLAKASDTLKDTEDAMDFLKLKARHYRAVENDIIPGRIVYVPRSLTEFDGPGLIRFRHRLVWLMIHDIIPGLRESDLKREIERMISGSPQVAA